jgi:hypothetical protein
MSTDRSMARCSFCGRYSSEVRRLIAGPGAANICDQCLQLCNEILQDTTPFSAKALELASRPPVVVAAPRIREQLPSSINSPSREPLRVVNIALEQKQQGMTLLLHSMHYYQEHFELHYVWMRPPLRTGFAFVPRIVFFLEDLTGMQWAGDRGGTLLARPELASGPNNAVYQGSARFQPLPSPDAHTLRIRVSDPLGQFEEPPLVPWEFEITL